MKSSRQATGRRARNKSRAPMPLKRIVSGGQTGVDRAALDAAINQGLEIGGWCPRGRRAEDGPISARYTLTETAARSYAVRTDWNVRDSDGTLILVLDDISSGTRLTIETARNYPRPLRIQHLVPSSKASLIREVVSFDEQVGDVVRWIRESDIRVLNVAGPRGSSSPTIYPVALRFVSAVLESLVQA
jgi:Circularly permutated YpsA SLOG family